MLDLSPEPVSVIAVAVEPNVGLRVTLAERVNLSVANCSVSEFMMLHIADAPVESTMSIMCTPVEPAGMVNCVPAGMVPVLVDMKEPRMVPLGPSQYKSYAVLARSPCGPRVAELRIDTTVPVLPLVIERADVESTLTIG